MSNNTNSSGGISFLGMLTILFIGLKLTNYIDWSWYWVLSPLWIPLAFVATVAAIAFVGVAVGVAVAAIFGKK